jgi:hypothetical protein
MENVKHSIKTILGAVVGVVLMFSLFWGAAIGCVVLGGAPEVCGL